jgi:ubiquinone/menaquinone biosynthesis C-methylase UbiE
MANGRTSYEDLVGQQRGSDQDREGRAEAEGVRRSGEQGVAVGVRAVYDAIARAYHDQLGNELAGKPLDRGILQAFAELAGAGAIADVGCGPGHVTRFLAAQNARVIGIDIAPGMLAVARENAPALAFAAGSMLALPAADAALSGIIALYSIIHLTVAERARACREFARAVHPGGWLLASFHIDSPDFAAGDVNHLTTWFGQAVELDGHFLQPADVARDVQAAGFTVNATIIRSPQPDIEYPSRRCYLLAQRH